MLSSSPHQSKRSHQYQEAEQEEYYTYAGRDYDPRFSSDALLLILKSMYYSLIIEKRELQPTPVPCPCTGDSIALPHLL